MVFCASGAAAETDDISGLSAGMRTSGSGHGWPKRRAASKNQGFKEYGPESAKLGSARQQGDKFPCEALGLDVKKCCFCQLRC